MTSPTWGLLGESPPPHLSVPLTFHLLQYYTCALPQHCWAVTPHFNKWYLWHPHTVWLAAMQVYHVWSDSVLLCFLQLDVVSAICWWDIERGEGWFAALAFELQERGLLAAESLLYWFGTSSGVYSRPCFRDQSTNEACLPLLCLCVVGERAAVLVVSRLCENSRSWLSDDRVRTFGCW
jgi:hypothetical protein